MNAPTATPRRRDPLSELDAWVLEELEAVLPRRAANEDDHVVSVADRWAPPPGVSAGLLTEEEEAFVRRTAAWLEGRPNADVLLEEVWRVGVRVPAEESDHDDEETASSVADTPEPPHRDEEHGDDGPHADGQEQG